MQRGEGSEAQQTHDVLTRSHVRAQLADGRCWRGQHRREDRVVRRIDLLRLLRCAPEPPQAARDAQGLLLRHAAEFLGELLSARGIEVHAKHTTTRLVEQEGEEGPVAQEVAAKGLVDGWGHLLDLVPESLQGAASAADRLPHPRIHRDPTDRFGEEPDAQAPRLGTHHHADGRKIGDTVKSLGFSEVVGGISHRACQHALGDEVDR